MKQRWFPAAERWIEILQWGLLVILLLRAGLFLVHSVQTILFPFPVDYDEGVVLHSALLMARGEAIYRPLEADAFVSSAYTPLFYLLTAPFLSLAGPTLVPGRLLALAATLGSAGLLYAMARQLGTTRRGALSTALMPLTMGTALIWATFAKPDTLALLLTLLLLYWVVRFGESHWVYLAGPWFALGFFAKQNTILVTGPVLLYLFIRRPRQGAAVAILAAVLTLGPFLLLNAASGGALYVHTLGFYGLPWEWAHFWSMFEPLLFFLPGLALLAVLGALRQLRQPRAWPALVLLGGGLLFLLTGGRIGTNWSFQLPLLFAMALLAGVLLFPARPAAGEVAPGSPSGSSGTTLPARWRLLLLGVAVAQFAFIPDPLRWYRNDLLASSSRQQKLSTVCAILRATPPPILSEDAGMLLLCGHEPRYDDPFLMAQLARAGLWDESTLVEQLEGEHFRLVVLAYDLATFPPERTELLRWTRAPLAALRTHYVLWQELGNVYLYRPRSSLANSGAGLPGKSP